MSTATPATALTAFSSGTYRHVAMTISGSTHTIYLDGVAIATNTNAGNVFATYSSLSKLYLGSAADLSYGFTGIIDDFKIWNRALPAIDIASVYANNTPKFGPIDYLSSTTKSAMLNTGIPLSAGAYGVRLLYSRYSGPILTIRRSADSVSANFYADTSGNLGTGFNGSGTSLISWLNSSLAYVSQWWDQTGNGNHATQSTTSAQPVYNTYYNNIDFSVYNTAANAWFNIPNGAFPYGTSKYSYIFKHGVINNNLQGTVYSGGNASPSSLPFSAQGGLFGFNYTGYRDVWWNNDVLTNSNTNANNAVISNKYDGTTRSIYINSSSQSLTVNSNNGTRNQTSTLNVLGKTPANNGSSDANFFNSQLFYFYYMPISISDPDRGILENTGIASYLYPTSILDNLSSTTQSYMLYRGATYTPNNLIPTIFTSSGGDFTVSSGGYTYVGCKTGQNITFTGIGSVEYVIVGGGGSGGNNHAGGGGAGAVSYGTVSISSGNYPIVVGLGGTTVRGSSNKGGNSSAFGITALGGGYGGGDLTGPATNGGSGGGGSGYNANVYNATNVPGTGAAVSGSVYGNTGGNGAAAFPGGGGGGGGSGGVGSPASGNLGGGGGIGTNAFSTWLSVIRSSMPSDWQTATTTGYIAAGGGGGSWGVSPVAGGTGGGGTSGNNNGGSGTIAPTNGINFTGSGGGGGGSGEQIGATGGNGFVMFRYIPSGFTVTTTNASTGVYGVCLLYGTYQGPALTVRRSSDSVTANFYADVSGNLGTGYLATGTSLTSWLNGATAYVTQWWDQTGNNNTAVQPITSAQPIYETILKYITFPSNANFMLPNGTHPFNNSQYSYVFKCSIPTATGSVFSGGTNTTNFANIFRRDTNNYMNSWSANNITSSGNTYQNNSVISLWYNGATRRIYQNTNQIATLASSGRQQPNTNNFIGKGIDTDLAGGYITYMYIAPIAISDADRAILEATPTAPVVGIPSGVTIPPVVAYVETDGDTRVTNVPILWTFLSGSQASQTSVVTKYSTTISSSAYTLLNGPYYTTSSSSLNSTTYSTPTDTTTTGPHEYGFSCFDGCYAGPILGTFGGNYYSWISNFTNYSQASPYVYTGGIYSTTVSGTSYGGEYVQLQLPNAVVIKGFKIYYPVNNTCGLMRAVFAGSNDGSTWTLIYTLNNGDTRPTQHTNVTYSFTNTTSYSYYRFICTGVQYDSFGTRLIGINELIFIT